MLEYTLDDAEVLLKKNCEQVVHIPMSEKLIDTFLSWKFYNVKHSQAEQNLAQIAWDLDYLRDQMTITEVKFRMHSE